MSTAKWVFCPICKGKTRLKILNTTELRNFPLYCPKCRNETMIHVKNFKIMIVKEPDA